MPRGGRRPGAGAPRGNFNALRHGSRSRSSRVSELLGAFVSHPERRQLLGELYDAGFFPAPRYEFNGDIRGLVLFLQRNELQTAASAPMGGRKRKSAKRNQQSNERGRGCG
jgi:hypothetical protein